MKSLFTLLFFLALFSLRSQELNTTRLDAFFEHIRMNDQGSGSVSIFKDGKEVYAHSTGFIDIENAEPKPNNKYTKYRIGSVTKTFTAVIILQMVQEGKLSLDDKLSKFYPPFPRGNEVTLRQLLNHHSGLHNITTDSEYHKGMLREWKRVELLDHFAAKGYDHKPDSMYSYSNTNYILLSMIAELVDGQFFAGIVKERICTPLGLISTYYGNELSVSNQEARSFEHYGKWKAKENTHHSIPLGAGGMVSTPHEMNIFMEALFAEKLIDKSQLDLMITPRGRMGLGIIPMEFEGRKSYGHNGAIDGYRAVVSHIPTESMSISYASNAERLDIDEILNIVMRIALDEEYAFPSFPAYTYAEGELERFKGKFINKKVKSHIDVSVLDATLFLQKKGQRAIPVDNEEHNLFSNGQLDALIKFNKKRSKFTLIQRGRKSVWKRQRIT